MIVTTVSGIFEKPTEAFMLVAQMTYNRPAISSSHQAVESVVGMITRPLLSNDACGAPVTPR